MAKKNDTTFFENKLLDFVTAKDPMLEMPYDFYEYDENAYSLTGKDSGRRYCIGQLMRVRVIRTNVFEKTIDLEEADE